MDWLSGYPRTLHLSDSGLPGGRSSRPRLDWSEVSGRHVVLEEKVDGTHSGLFFDVGGGAHAFSRGTEIDLDVRGGAERRFDAFKDWLEAQADALLDRLEDRYALHGEWVKEVHSIYYDRLPHFFLEFDVQDMESGEFLSTQRRKELLDGLPLASVPVLYEGVAGPAVHPSSFVTKSLFKSPDWRVSCLESAACGGSVARALPRKIEDCDLAEGVYGKVEEDGRVVARFKWVREEFVRHIVDGKTHWKSGSAILNRLAPGADVLPFPQGPAISFSR